MTAVAAAIATLTLGSAMTMAAGQRGSTKPADMPVTSVFFDQDASTGAMYSIQSDMAGPYYDGQDSVTSVLMANVFNNLYNGDWEMISLSSATRTVGISLYNPVPAGWQGYTVPPKPPFQFAYKPAKVMAQCTGLNKSMLTMAVGPDNAITCSVVVAWNDKKGAVYRLYLNGKGTSEATPALITCNQVSSVDGNCTDWFVDPYPIVHEDGSVSAIARLIYVQINGTETNLGDFYTTFHFHITRP